MAGTIIDVSAAGMAIQVGGDIAIGTPVAVHLRRGSRPIEIRGRAERGASEAARVIQVVFEAQLCGRTLDELRSAVDQD